MQTYTADGVLALPATTVARAAVHWSVYAVLFASTSVLVGVLWDISWHQTIGRDTFWTPAHLAIYLGGTVAGLTCGWTALRLTFAGTVAERAATVRFWGFHAPFGAWVCIWGAFAMLTSAPFDDWWHNTYGLDVKILSPPHIVLAAGIGAIQVGAMLMALAWQNRAAGHDRRLQRLFVYGAGLLLLTASIMAIEYLQRWDMHRAMFYQVACGVFPFFLVSAARGSAARWPATMVAAVYTLVLMLMVWILPLFEGRPLLGPIYVPVDRFLPPDPPLLLIVPAFALDVVMHRFGRARDWTLSFVAAAVFLAVFIAAQWPFADFLVSTWSRNWVFGTHLMAYGVPPNAQARWWELSPPDNLIVGLPIALLLGIASVRCGLWWGNWMARVQR
jgi:hypothetical protein